MEKKYNENKPIHTGDPVVEAKRACIEHRAIWMALLLDEVRKAGGDMEKIGRAAINRCGCFQAVANYKDHMKDPNSMKEFGDIFVAEPVTFENKVVNIDDEEVHVEMHYCPLLTAWRKLGFSPERNNLLPLQKGRRLIPALFFDAFRNLTKTAAIAIIFKYIKIL